MPITWQTLTRKCHLSWLLAFTSTPEASADICPAPCGRSRMLHSVWSRGAFMENEEAGIMGNEFHQAGSLIMWMSTHNEMQKHVWCDWWNDSYGLLYLSRPDRQADEPVVSLDPKRTRLARSLATGVVLIFDLWLYGAKKWLSEKVLCWNRLVST